jgi:hypothetical protein
VTPQPTQGQILYDASEAVSLAERARAALEEADLIVDSDSMLTIAANDLKAVKSLQQLVEDRRTAITKPLNQALKQVNDLFRSPKDFLIQAEKRLKDAILQHTTRQEEIAAAARQRAEQEMRQQSDSLIAEQQEHQRISQRAAQCADEEMQKASEAESRGDLQAAESARQAARAQMQLAGQSRALSIEIGQSVQVFSLPSAALSPTKVDGVSSRTTYAAVVTDLMALVRAVAAGQAPIECLQPDEKFLGAQARAFKKSGFIFPGVQAAAHKSLAVAAESRH